MVAQNKPNPDAKFRQAKKEAADMIGQTDAFFLGYIWTDSEGNKRRGMMLEAQPDDLAKIFDLVNLDPGNAMAESFKAVLTTAVMKYLSDAIHRTWGPQAQQAVAMIALAEMADYAEQQKKEGENEAS